MKIKTSIPSRSERLSTIPPNRGSQEDRNAGFIRQACFPLKHCRLKPAFRGQRQDAHSCSFDRKQHAFTLVELLLVLVILGTLAAIVLPKFTGTTQRSRVTATQTQISTFKTALNAFEVDMGYYPKSLLELIQQPRNGAQNWHGPYLDSDAIPKDPWGNDYLYTCPGKHNPSSYDVMSPGPDGQVGTDDDICNWTVKR